MYNLTSLIFEISTEKELEKEIEKYFTVQKELEEKNKAIEDRIAEIKKMKKDVSSKFSIIEKYMKEHNIQEKKVKSWVARLRIVAAYKRVQPSYKTNWLTLLQQVNAAHRNVMQNVEDAEVATKRAETKIELELQSEGIGDILKGNSKVLATLKLKGNKDDSVNSFYKVYSEELNEFIYVTGQHYIYDRENNKFIHTKNSPLAVEANEVTSDYLSCLVTTDHRIRIGEHIFWDWED